MAGIPLTPEEEIALRAAQDSASYYGVPGTSMSGGVPAPTDPASYYGPPRPVEDAGPLYPSASYADSPPPAPPGPQFSWNAPGFENAHSAPFSGGPPPAVRPPGVTTRDTPEPPPVSLAPIATPDPVVPKAAPTLDPHYGSPPTRSVGGGAGVRDPYGVDAARKGLRGTYDTEAGAVQRGADIAKDRADSMARGAHDLADQKTQEAELQQIEAKQAADHFRDYEQETQRQLDAVKDKTIDPNRLYADGGQKALAIFGAVIGGMYQGAHGMASNPFIDQMNKNIDRDIAVQEKNLASERASISERRSLLGDMRATYKDEALAKAQAKNLYWEAAKEHLAAVAADSDSALEQNHADLAITAISREQAKLDMQTAMQKAAAAQAAAGAAAAAQERARKAALEERKMRVDEGELLVKAGEEKNKHADKIDEQTQKLGKELSDEKIVAARKTIDDLKRKLVNPETGEIDGSRRVPGTGQAADTRDELFGTEHPTVAQSLIPGYSAAHYFGKLTPEERISRQDWGRLYDSYKVAITGASGNPEELASLKKSFQGANTPAEQANAIRLADEALAGRENRIKAGYDPEVARYYDKRVGEESAARPKTVKREPVK